MTKDEIIQSGITQQRALEEFVKSKNLWGHMEIVNSMAMTFKTMLGKYAKAAGLDVFDLIEVSIKLMDVGHQINRNMLGLSDRDKVEILSMIFTAARATEVH